MFDDAEKEAIRSNVDRLMTTLRCDLRELTFDEHDITFSFQRKKHPLGETWRLRCWPSDLVDNFDLLVRSFRASFRGNP